MVMMENLENVDVLQQVADYRTVRKVLRASGGFSILFGLLGIITGVAGIAANPLNVILALIGLVMLTEGIYCLIWPKPIMFIPDGIVFILIGLWNISLGFQESSQASHWATFGVFQLFWGFDRFSLYKRYRHVSGEKPPEELFKQVDTLASAIGKARMKDTGDLIEFATKNGLVQQYWKGRVSGDRAVFIDKRSHYAMFARKQDVEFTKTGKVLLGKTVRATIRVKERTLKASMSPESFERYELWKMGAK